RLVEQVGETRGAALDVHLVSAELAFDVAQAVELGLHDRHLIGGKHVLRDEEAVAVELLLLLGGETVDDAELGKRLRCVHGLLLPLAIRSSETFRLTRRIARRAFEGNAEPVALTRCRARGRRSGRRRPAAGPG